MLEKLIPLEFPPGLFKNGTVYQAQGRWYDANGVRFFRKAIRPIGGWRTMLDSSANPLAALSGVPRGAIAWARAAGSTTQVAVGTHTRLYAIIAGVLSNITPAGFTTGAQDSSLGAAYGAGNYGAGPYGLGIGSTLVPADTWQFDAFGETMVACFTADGRLLVWDNVGVDVATVVAGAPTSCRGVVITPERFLVALGAGGDARSVQWASQNTTTTWGALSTNTAGQFTLTTVGRIMCGRRTKSQTLIFTDVDMFSMNYRGDVFVYGFKQEGVGCGLVAPNAVATTDTAAYWMGKNGFFAYDGYAHPLASEVHDAVFGNLNTVQVAKIFAVALADFGEIWWFYPSAGSTENDSYVVYNYQENHWTVGKLARTAGFDRGATTYPVMCEPGFSATGTLTSTGTTPTNGDTVTLGAKTYTFQTVLTNVDGNVLIGANAAAALTNLFNAINLGPGSGTTYAAATTLHPTVSAETVTATTIVVRAKSSGTGGNTIASTKVAVTLSWGAVTLINGGTSVGFAVGIVDEHEYLDTRTGMTPYLESGPMELGSGLQALKFGLGTGENLVRVQRIVPDEKNQGDTQVLLYTSLFPNQAEVLRGPYTNANPTNVRTTARQVRIRHQEVNPSSWRVGITRLGVIPGGRR